MAQTAAVRDASDGKDSRPRWAEKHCGTSNPPMSTWDHKAGPKALGLTIPETLLATGDEVIE
jgi:hypothetical protein